MPTPAMATPALPDSPRYGKETGEQREQLEGVLGQIGGKHSQVKEVEDEELHRLGHILPVDLHLPPRLSEGPKRRKAQ